MNIIDKNAYERARWKKHRDIFRAAYIKKIKKEYGAKVIPNHSDYYASKCGKIFSIIKTRELKLRMIQKRASVNLRISCKKYKNLYVHRLVMAAFYGHSKLVVNHKDGNPLNNHIDNLEYCTQAYNIQHSQEILGRGWIRKGVHVNSKLKKEDLIYILINKNVSNAELAKKYKVDQAIISNVRLGKKYKRMLSEINKQGGLS